MAFLRQDSFYRNVTWFELHSGTWNNIHTAWKIPKTKKRFKINLFRSRVDLYLFHSCRQQPQSLSIPVTSSERLGTSPRLSVPSSTGPTFSIAASCGVRGDPERSGFNTLSILRDNTDLDIYSTPSRGMHAHALKTELGNISILCVHHMISEEYFVVII